MSVLRFLESVHGHLGVLAAAACLHPAILLWRGSALSFGRKWAIGLSIAFTVLVFGSGLFLYGSYRALLKVALFRESFATGMLFETKEHTVFAILSLVLGAGACALLAPPTGRELRRLAAAQFALAFALCVFAACIGSYVASVRDFS